MNRVVSFFADVKIIWLGLAIFVSVAAWAGDTRYMLKEDGDKIVMQIKLANMEASADDMEVQRSLMKDEEKAKMLDAIIKIKRSRIDNMIKKYSIK